MASEVFRAIADSVRGSCPPGVGFALWLDGPTLLYASNGDRRDLAATVIEWRAKAPRLAGSSDLAPRVGETPVGYAYRRALERHCADEGEALCASLGAGAVFLLFVFDLGGPGGRLAWAAQGDTPVLWAMLGRWLRAVHAAPPSAAN
jgi:hypothetical protein